MFRGRYDDDDYYQPDPQTEQLRAMGWEEVGGGGKKVARGKGMIGLWNMFCRQDGRYNTAEYTY